MVEGGRERRLVAAAEGVDGRGGEEEDCGWWCRREVSGWGCGGGEGFVGEDGGGKCVLNSGGVIERDGAREVKGAKSGWGLHNIVVVALIDVEVWKFVDLWESALLNASEADFPARDHVRHFCVCPTWISYGLSSIHICAYSSLAIDVTQIIMGLCPRCAQLPLPGTGPPRIKYHPSFIHLEQSSQTCPVCKAFLDIFLSTGRTRMGIPQDVETRTNAGETNHLTIVVPEEHSSRNRFSPAGSRCDISFTMNDWRNSSMPVKGYEDIVHRQLEVSCRDRVWTSEPLVFMRAAGKFTYACGW